MKYLLACLMLLLMHQSVNAHEFIEQLKERSSEFDNCEFTIEHHLTYLPMFESEMEAKKYAEDVINERLAMAREPIPENKIQSMINEQVKFYLEGGQSSLKYVCRVKDINNFSMFTFKDDDSLFHVLVHLDDREFTYFSRNNNMSLNPKTERDRSMIMLFEHEKVYSLDGPKRIFFGDKNNTNKINYNADEKIHEMIFKDVTYYFPISFKSISANGMSEIRTDEFKVINGISLPSVMKHLYYKQHPKENKYYLENESDQIIKNFKFKEQNIDWLIPEGLHLQNRITGKNYVISEPILVSELNTK